MANNHNFIIPELATGGDVGYGNEAVPTIEALVGAGVTHVLDNREEWSDEDLFLVVAPHIVYCHNGVDDAHEAVVDRWFDRGVNFAMAAWEEDPNAVVFSHCHMGINRGPSMAYRLLLERGHDPVEALALIREARSIAYIRFAPEALDHFHRRHPVGAAQRIGERSEVLRWMRDNSFDVAAEIARIRRDEAA